MGIIPRRVSFLNFFKPKLRKILNQIENTHGSVAQTDFNNEKNGGRKSHWTVPLSNSK